MDIDIAEANPDQPANLNEMQDLFMADDRRLREGLQEPQNFSSVSQVSAGQFADDMGMAEHDPFVEERGEPFAPMPEVLNPNGGIDQDHRLTWRPSFLLLLRFSASVSP